MVRRALVMATDRASLASKVLNGFSVPSRGGMVPPGIPGHSSEIGISYEPAAAKAFLEQSSFRAGKGANPITLRTPADQKTEAEMLISQWEKAPDMKFVLETMD